MSATHVHIEGNIVEVDGVANYHLYAACTNKGGLPDTRIFLWEIFDPADVSKDVFKRVLQVADMDADVGYQPTRDLAIQAGQVFWRSGTLNKYYTDVEVAVQAKQVLQDEVNRLTTEYADYQSGFETIPADNDRVYPIAQDSIVEALITTYDAAYSDYEDALTAQTAAALALTATQDDYDTVSFWSSKQIALETALRRLEDEMTDAQGQFTDFAGAAEPNAGWFSDGVAAQISAIGALDPTIAKNIQDLVNAFEGRRAIVQSTIIGGTISAAVADHSTQTATLYIPSDKTDIASAQTALTAASAAKVAANAAASAQYAILNNAYAAVKAVYPAWVPENPLPPPPVSI